MNVYVEPAILQAIVEILQARFMHAWAAVENAIVIATVCQYR